MVPAPREAATSSRQNWLKRIAVLLGLVLLTVFTQYRSGAYRTDFSLDPDEPSHAVSSLMVRDYLTQAFPKNPLHFAHDFYAHYPKVAIGHWPPLFYCVEALWMLLAGRTRIAMLLFVALCGVALATSVYCAVRKRSSPAIAGIGVAVLVCSPTFQRMLCGVRPDLLLALLVFWAAIFCAEYMFYKRRADLMRCLALSTAALLVHGRAAILLLLPFSILLLQRRRPGWRWIVAAALLLFFILWPHIVVPESHISATSVSKLLLTSVWRTVLNVEWLPAVPVGIGMVLTFRDRSQHPFWAAMTGLAIAGFVFDLLVPIDWDDYYLITSLPALAALAGHGTQYLCTWIADSGRVRLHILHNAVASLAFVALLLMAYFVMPKQDLGYHRLVAACALCNNEVALIAANGLNEGALIAEGSLADPHRTHTILRGSKALSTNSWSGSRYRAKFQSVAEVSQFLDSANVSLVLVQIGGYSRTDIQQLRSAVVQNAEWAPVTTGTQVEGMEIYRRIAPAQRLGNL